MSEALVMFFVFLLLTAINVGVLGLTIKLYTEFAKQRMQEARKP